MKNQIASLMVLFLALSALAGCRTVKHIVTKIDPNPSNDINTKPTLPSRGFVYALPLTQVAVEVPVILTKKKPGPFADQVINYESHLRGTWDTLPTGQQKEIKKARAEAWRLLNQLGIEDPVVCTQPNSRRPDCDFAYKAKPETKEFEIDTPKISSEAIPDTENIYLVHIKGGSFEDRSLDLKLTEEGFLASGTSAAKDRTLDLALKAIEVVAGVVQRVSVQKIMVAESAKRVRAAATRPPPSPSNPYPKAIEVAKAIADVRQRILNVKFGEGFAETPPDTFKLILEELKKHESELVNYFWKSSAVLWPARVVYQPKEDHPPPKVFDLMVDDKVNRNILYLANGGTNLVQKIPKAFLKEKGQPQPEGRAPITISQEPMSNVASILKKYSWPPANELGFRYRIPGEALIQVKMGKRVLAQRQIPVAQLGPVVALPSDTGSTNSKYAIKLFTELGAMQNIRIDSTGIQPATIEGAGAAAEAVASAVAAQKEAKSEVARLKKEVELLRLRKEKVELEEALSVR